MEPNVTDETMRQHTKTYKNKQKQQKRSSTTKTYKNNTNLRPEFRGKTPEASQRPEARSQMLFFNSVQVFVGFVGFCCFCGFRTLGGPSDGFGAPGDVVRS